MLKTVAFIFCVVTIASSTSASDAQSSAIAFDTKSLQISLGDRGHVIGLLDRASGEQYAVPDQSSPLLQVFMEGSLVAPGSMEWEAESGRLTFHYGPVRAVVQATAKPTYVAFELIAVEPAEAVDRVQWGPIATRITSNAGETIGVVRDENFSIGLQVLNPKTIGGPASAEGIIEGRGQTALITKSGSTLQAFSLDRSRPRSITVWGGHFPNMPVPPIPGETVIGSRIALFGCPAGETLDHLGQIGKGEGLPHPEFDGVWSRANPQMGRAYLITEFSEENIAELLDYAQRGSFISLYHGHPFQTWGHYELRRDHFPRGKESMKACVAAAAERGLRIGVHTLTNFINPSDPYVSPVPDSRLAKTGSSPLTAAIDAEQSEIEVASPEYFANEKANWLRTVMIDEELIRYGAVSDSAPWKLQNCQRGAWGTQAKSHASEAEVAKLMDHPYQVFFPNYEMQYEIALRLADLFNETGIGHLDFDGHEGCWATGQGTFGSEKFAQVFFDRLKHPVLNGSSQILPFYWRINTNTNWGEPWYGGFRGSMAEYRINNQALFDRNFMPHMMGWFLLTPGTTLADIEWLMARNAGYDAGFALSAGLPALRGNPRTGDLLDTIATWERLRIARAFTDVQRERLRDTDQQFHLERNDSHTYRLFNYRLSPPFKHEQVLRQPGEPTGVKWKYEHPTAEQQLQFVLQVEGTAGEIQNARLELDNYVTIELPVTVSHGQQLVCDGTQTLRILDASGNLMLEHELAKAPPKLTPGMHAFGFSCDFHGEPSPIANIQFKSIGDAETITVDQAK